MKWNSRRVHVLVVVFVMLAVLLANAPQLTAQTVAETILGTVKDAQGAAGANASVTARSEEAAAERTAMTDSSGGFTIVSVPAGAYDVTVTAQSFQTEIQKGLTLTVGAFLRAATFR
jgi:hypothetical protein